MGMTSDAHCYNCGYDTGLTLGAGRSNFRTFAAWPVHCRACRAITTANYKSEPLACLRCGSHEVTRIDDPANWQGDGTTKEMCFDLTITDGHYRCPICETFSLRFATNATGQHRKIRFD